MSASSWREIISLASADGAALANSAVAASLLPASAKAPLLASFFDRLPKRLRVQARGRISTVVTTPGTFTFDLRFKDSAGTTVVVWNGGAINLNVVAQVNATWELEAEFDLKALGSVANLLGIGKWTSRALVGSAAVAAGSAGVIMLPDTAPAVGANFDATQLAQIVDLFGTWSIANAANSLTLHQYTLEAAN